MKRRILIIETNSTLLGAYRDWLSLIGYQVESADSLQAAEQYLENHRYHIVVYDIDSAGARGIDFLREYWLQFKIEGTRVAVISQHGRYRYECESMGLPFYTHPLRVRDLERIIIGLVYSEFRPPETQPLSAMLI